MDLISKHYTTRTWEHLTVDPYDEEAMNSQPKTRATNVRHFSSESDLAISAEYALEKKTEEQRATYLRGDVIWDYELAAAGLGELGNAGGSLAELSEPWRDHPEGSLVITVYRQVPREGKLASVIFEILVEG